MKIKLLLMLACVTSARAANYVGDQTFSAPFTLNEGANIVGNVTFSTPGTYSASNWNIVGQVRFGAPGTYTVTATSAGISFAGNVFGPAAGAVTVHVSYRTTVNFVGTVAPTITVLDDSAAPPPVPDETVNPPPPAPLINLSTRVSLSAGGVLNTGFVVGGSTTRRVLVRAVGPGLAPFGVAAPLANPTLAVYSGSLQIGANDDWDKGANLPAIFAAVGAFGLPPASKDAAVVLTLAPGAYTVAIRAATASDAGDVLAEVYLLE